MFSGFRSLCEIIRNGRTASIAPCPIRLVKLSGDWGRASTTVGDHVGGLGAVSFVLPLPFFCRFAHGEFQLFLLSLGACFQCNSYTVMCGCAVLTAAHHKHVPYYDPAVVRCTPSAIVAFLVYVGCAWIESAARTVFWDVFRW